MFLRNQQKLFIRCLLSFCLFILPFKKIWAKSQIKASMDQLVKQAEIAKDDTIKINLLIQITGSYRSSDKKRRSIMAIKH